MLTSTGFWPGLNNGTTNRKSQKMKPQDLFMAFLLDALVGDPRRFPHPVRGIGLMITGFEKLTRRLIPNKRAAGGVTLVLVVSITALTVWSTLLLAGRAGEGLHRLTAVFWVALGLSIRDLSDSALRVYRALDSQNLPKARRALSAIVGRDTNALDESGVSRASVESVAESLVDGVLSPLFFTVLGGPVFLWIFKAASTCDSMLGYRNARYGRFGAPSARLDDILNYVPARFCFVLIPLAAKFLKYSATESFKTSRRDSGRHASPNAGIPEAAMAGALGVRLGGDDTYQGKARQRAVLGEGFPEAGPQHIPQSVKVMWLASILGLLAAGLFLTIKIFFK
jgi:adenosylcobinamide-phosphate synthase